MVMMFFCASGPRMGEGARRIGWVADLPCPLSVDRIDLAALRSLDAALALSPDDLSGRMRLTAERRSEHGEAYEGSTRRQWPVHLLLHPGLRHCRLMWPASAQCRCQCLRAHDSSRCAELAVEYFC